MYYHSLNQYLLETFGEKVYKLSLSSGCTCPNRDGTVGTGGCIFCNGSGDFAADPHKPIAQQLLDAKALIQNKTKAQKFIAYFQDYSNTYGSVSDLRIKFLEAISDPQVVVLSIATRPDCLSDEILQLLFDLRKQIDVWVELGLQTVHEDTARFIRRGYPLACYDTAVQRLHSMDIQVVTHQILGLPGETREQMLQTTQHIADVHSDGIKFHLLHVLKNTELAGLYQNGMFETMDMDTYISVLADCIRLLPKETVIHRMTGDGAKRNLIAPLWSADKKRVLNAIQKRFSDDYVVQGSLYHAKT